MNQSLDPLSFFGGIASIVGVFVAIWGGKKLSRYLRQSTKATARGGGNAAATTAQTMTSNIIVTGDFVTVDSVEEVRARLAATPAPAAPQPNTSDVKEAELRRALEELVARPSTAVSALLLAAHKLARHRGDNDRLLWIQREMDGYTEADASALSQDEKSHRFVDGYFLADIGGGRTMDFPLTLFEAKSADRLEDVIAESRTTQNPLSTEIVLPDDMRAFFEKENFGVPPKVRFFIEVAQLKKIISAIRVRLLEYLRTLS